MLLCSHADFNSESLLIDPLNRKMKNLSNELLGKLVDEIWACKKCYDVFETNDSLEDHRILCTVLAKDSSWNELTKKYTCPVCEKVLKTKHVVWFSRHLKECHKGGIKKKQKKTFSCDLCEK